jgi:hypothetical protein
MSNQKPTESIVKFELTSHSLDQEKESQELFFRS